MFKATFFAWLICAIVGAFYGTKKGMGLLGFFLGVFGGPWGVVFVLKQETLSKDGRLIAKVVGINVLIIVILAVGTMSAMKLMGH